MLKTEAFAGAIRPDQEKAQVVLRVPAERKPEQSRLEVRYSPTLAGALVDALPYLADYPYGCTEQTLNRFLPTVITQKVLINLGLDLKAIRDKHTNLNAQQLGDARERGKQWKGYEHNPVFDQAEVAKMAARGHPAPGRHAALRRRLGLVLRLRRIRLGPHDGPGRPRPASRPPATTWRCPRGCSNGASPGSRTTRPSRSSLLENGVSQVKPYKTSADDLDALVFMVLADAGVAQRPDARLPGSRSHASLGLCARRCSAWAWSGSARRTSWRPCSRTSASTSSATTRTRRPTSSCPTRVTGGGGTAARSRPTRSTSSCWPAPIPRASWRRGWSSTC